MEKELRVSDAHRTNELSLRPGGSEVRVVKNDGKVLVYDKIKDPERYINRLPKPEVKEIYVNDLKVWPFGNEYHSRGEIKP